MVCHVYDVVSAPVRPRNRCVKGWCPRSLDDAADFKANLSKLPSDSSVGFLEKSLVEISASIPHTTQAQRSRSFCAQEPANVAKARVRLSQAQTPEDKALWGKALYRRCKRKWLNWVARRRFDLSADKLSRSDRSSARQVRWLDDGSGDRVFDTARWPEIARPFFSNLYTSALESTDAKCTRLSQLGDACAAARLDGSKTHVHLPLYVLFDSRQKMSLNKQCGSDQIVSDMFGDFDLDILETIRCAFEKRLGSRRRAGPHCHTDPVPEWDTIVVQLIPKTLAAHFLTLWRPISLVSAFAKWYLSCLVFLLRSHSSPARCRLLGIEPGRQTMECSEFIRLLFQKCSEWGRPLYLGRGDAHKAFDSMEHPGLDRALKARDTPLCLRAATLRELVGVTLQTGDRCSPLPLGKGGKQGASDTPCTWNFPLDDILADTVQEWARNCFGVSLGDAWEPISHLVWADDIRWFSNSWDEFCTMSQDLTSALADGQLSWKPSSLQYLMNVRPWPPSARTPPEGFCTLDRSGAPLHFTRVSSVEVLGVLVDGVGDSPCSLEHRLSATLKHFYARFPQFTCKRTGLKRRVKMLYGTVFRSALHGAGGRTLSQALLARGESFELSLLRRVVQVLKTPGEGFASYMQRSATSIRGWIRRSGQTTLATLILRTVRGWAGHLARLPAESLISRILKYRNLEWWRETQLVLGKTDHLNRTQWRHSRPGQFARWETCLARLDKRWLSLAADRNSWHLQKVRFVTSESLRLGCKSGIPDSENSGIPCDAKHDGRIMKRRPASAAPAPRFTPPAPPSRGPHSPYPRPGLCPCPGPVLIPPPPSFSPLSSLSAPLPSFWSAARVREGLPAGVSLSCFTGSDETVDLVLCAATEGSVDL